MLNMLYDSVPNVLSELIRTAFIPRPGYKFIVSDFSAIEARVLSHLAGELWRTDVFRNGGDIYCASASQMFHVPVEKHGANSHLRQKGKIAELALGYGGSVGALKAMGALDMGLSEDELQPLVNMWRNSNPNIVSFWWQIDNAIKTAIQLHTTEKVGSLEFTVKNGMLFITLPSGRKLAYVQPRIGMNQFGGDGPYFIAKDVVVPSAGNEIDKDKFNDVFKHKVLMYLFDDAAKQKRSKLFEGISAESSRYSKICKAFDEKGVDIFHSSIRDMVRSREYLHEEKDPEHLNETED